jgi:GNAT superfamily N-acetyltransferase
VTRAAQDAAVAARARAFHHGRHDAVCDVVEPWEHGTVVRSTHHPSYYDFNNVRVEDEPGMTVAELVAFADEALAGLDHRRVDFEVAEAGDARRAGFEALGWETMRLVWMHHEAPPPPAAEIAVEGVPYEDVLDLRIAWIREDHPGDELTSYLDEAQEVAMRGDARVLAVREDGVPVAFAQLERSATAAEITQVYVRPDRRGGGRGTAMTTAAIAAASGAEDLWIIADDEARAKDLYERLGFRPVWRMMECTLRP